MVFNLNMSIRSYKKPRLHISELTIMDRDHNYHTFVLPLDYTAHRLCERVTLMVQIFTG